MPKRSKWELCPVCEGEGVTVNPNIDANGLTASDFRDDPDFAEAYMDGRYDISCRGCNGRRVVTAERIEELAEHAADRRLAAMEDGNYEAYSVAGDWRYG